MQKPISVCNNTNNQQDSYLKNLYNENRSILPFKKIRKYKRVLNYYFDKGSYYLSGKKKYEF